MVIQYNKILASILCGAFLSVQATFATPLTGGNFARQNVLNDTGLGGATISGHSDGLTAVKTDGTTANLNFNNNTRIDWSSLNVGSGQTLNFKNGTNAVLNNVLNGMSTFAGKVTGENGAIIIANPNGMLLNGGQFETSGSIILTTKNLLNLGVDDLKDEATINNAINNAKYNSNEYHIISIGKNGTTSSSLTSNSKNINIISKGINIDGANLTSNGTDGILLETSDGQNFVASLNKNKGVADNVNFGTNSIQIANSSIKANSGRIQLISNDSGDITATTNNTFAAPSLVAQSARNLNLKNISTWRTITASADKDATVSDLSTGITDLTATKGNLTANKLTSWTSITANAGNKLTLDTATTNTSDLTATKDINVSNLTSHTSIKATAGNTLTLNTATTDTSDLTATKDANVSNLTSNQSINATSTNGNINLSGTNKTNQTTLDATNGNISIKNKLTSSILVKATAGNEINATDLTGVIESNNVTLKATNRVNLTNNYVNWCKVTANSKNVGVTVIGDYIYGTTTFNPNITINATDGLFVNATGNVTVDNQTLNTYGTVGFSGTKVLINHSTISGNIIADATNDILVKDSTIKGSQAKLTANKNVVLEGNTINVDAITKDAKGNITNGGLILRSKNNGFVQIGWTNLTGNVETYHAPITGIVQNYVNNITGDINLSTGSRVSVNHANITGNIEANGNNVFYTDNNIIGNSDLTATNKMQLDKSIIKGDVIATTKKNGVIKEDFIKLYSTNIDGNAQFTSGSGIILGETPYNENRTLLPTLPENKISGNTTLIANGNQSNGSIDISNTQLNNFTATSQNANITLSQKGDFNLNNNTKLKAKDITISAEKTLSLTDVTADSLNAANTISLNAVNVITNNSTLGVDTKISANVGLANIQSTIANSNLAINNANNIIINNSKINGTLSITNSATQPFATAVITKTNALSTKFENGKSIIIDLTGANIFGNNRLNIINNDSNIQNIKIYPLEQPAITTSTQETIAQEATKTINTYKVSDNSAASQSFTPIAFAANEHSSHIHKGDGNNIYRNTSDNSLHIKERVNVED